jgi:transglutaminase-like putative cysteine protease
MRRYFEGLLLMLLATGFFALASTGRLPWPLEALGVGGFALRVWAFHGSRRMWLANRYWLGGLVLYLPVYALDGLVFSGSFLDASLHLVVLAGLAKLFAPPSAQDDLLLGLLGFLEMLTAALLTDSGTFLLLLIFFLILLVAALVAREVVQAEAGGSMGRSAPPKVRASLFRFSLGLSGAVALCTAAIFLLLPRTTVAAWGSRAGARGLSGFSDDVRLGALASVQRSDRPVMHIRIGAADPPLTPAALQQLYWRGRGLTTFDGQRWYDTDAPSLFATRGGRLVVARPQIGGRARVVRYRVTLEPMNSPVLFFPSRLLWADTHFPVLAWERRTATLSGLGRNFAGASYAGASDLSRPSAAALRAAPSPSARLLRYALADDLELPDGLDPRIPALARHIVEHAPTDNWDRMQALMAYLQSHYQYTLDDLPQGPDPLSSFLFDQQSGDCEYFASALAVLARTLAIPTRLVNGFTMGTYNPLTGEYVVRGSDAHTWVEAYFPVRLHTGRDFEREPRGEWVRFDPTPAATAAAGGWTSPGMLMDALSSAWQRWVVSYDWWRQARLAGQMQLRLGADLAHVWGTLAMGAGIAWRAMARAPAPRGRRTQWPALVAAGVGFALLLLAAAGLRRRRHRRMAAGVETRVAIRRAQRAYRRFQRALRRAGVARAPAQTGDELVVVLASARPGSPLAAAARDFVNAYQAVRFGASAAAASQLADCLKRVRRAV